MYKISLRQALACAYCMAISAVSAYVLLLNRSLIDCPDHFLMPINLVLTLCGVWILKDAQEKGKNPVLGLTWSAVFIGFLLAMTAPQELGTQGVYLVLGFLVAGLSTVFLRLGVSTSSNLLLVFVHALIWSLVFFKQSNSQWISWHLAVFLFACWLISYHVWRFAPRLERLAPWDFASRLYLGIPNTLISLVLRRA